MITARKICVFIKCSLKREKILERMQENFEGNFDPDTDKFLALEKLPPTLWNVRASCFQKASTATVCYWNYEMNV